MTLRLNILIALAGLATAVMIVKFAGIAAVLRPLISVEPTEASLNGDHSHVRIALPPCEMPPPLPERVDYVRQVVPLFEQCVSCHHLPELLSPESWKSGCCLEFSWTSKQLLERWWSEGSYIPPSVPATRDDWSEFERNHWAFQPLSTPPASLLDHFHGFWAREERVSPGRTLFATRQNVHTNPKVALERAIVEDKHPIDLAIEAALPVGLDPAPRADRRTLIRRYTLLLIGLPLDPDSMDEWLTNNRPLTELVDELLASPRYGEHFARFWLDLVRYADSNGYEHDSDKPHAWRYRDYIINAFNNDVGYDELLQSHLAGDLLPDPTLDDFIATGWMRLGPWDSEPNDELEAHYEQVAEIVETFGRVFLAQTIGCARCHDHPEEPYTAQDYARLTGCFHGLVRTHNGRVETSIPAATEEQLAQAATTEREVRRLRKQALLSKDIEEVTRLRRLAAELEFRSVRPLVYRYQETDLSSEPASLLHRGDPYQPRERVQAGVPSVLTVAPFPGDSMPRRELARWLLTEQSGLTARIIVNRVWAWHFGRGLVESLSNFGTAAPGPSHPELLEYLANWFVNEADWSLKKLHRYLLTSQAFARSARPDDPDLSEKYAAFRPRRLRAEMIHDQLLFVSGLMKQHSEGVHGSITTEKEQAGQRAIYHFVRRNAPHPFLSLYDFPDGSESCASRSHAQTTAQSLALWNGDFAQRCSEAIARRVINRSANLDEQIDYAYRVIFCRTPNEEERRLLQGYFSGRSSHDLWREACLVLMNSHELLWIY